MHISEGNGGRSALNRDRWQERTIRNMLCKRLATPGARSQAGRRKFENGNRRTKPEHSTAEKQDL